jgi:hypothetical protein
MCIVKGLSIIEVVKMAKKLAKAGKNFKITLSYKTDEEKKDASIKTE